MYTKTIEEQLEDKIAVDGDCWSWTAARDTKGYGVVRVAGRLKRAHRVVYEWLIGPIPDGLVIDHLCRVRHCVNPWHMEPVTMEENFARAPKAVPTHCVNGHPLVRLGGRQRCRVCAAAASRRHRAKASG